MALLSVQTAEVSGSTTFTAAFSWPAGTLSIVVACQWGQGAAETATGITVGGTDAPIQHQHTIEHTVGVTAYDLGAAIALIGWDESTGPDDVVLTLDGSTIDHAQITVLAYDVALELDDSAHGAATASSGLGYVSASLDVSAGAEVVGAYIGERIDGIDDASSYGTERVDNNLNIGTGVSRAAVATATEASAGTVTVDTTLFSSFSRSMLQVAASFVEAASGVSGELAETAPAQTSAATGGVIVSGAIAETAPAQTAAAAGAPLTGTAALAAGIRASDHVVAAGVRASDHDLAADTRAADFTLAAGIRATSGA